MAQSIEPALDSSGWSRSLTCAHWVPLSCGSLPVLRPAEPDSRNQRAQGVYIWAFHPVRFVYLTGLASDVRVMPKAGDKSSDTARFHLVFSLDDGTGPPVQVWAFDRADVPQIDSKFVEVYGTVRDYKGRREVVAQDIKIPDPDLGREIDLQYEACRVQLEILSKKNSLPAFLASSGLGGDRRVFSLSRAGSPMESDSRFQLIDTI